MMSYRQKSRRKKLRSSSLDEFTGETWERDKVWRAAWLFEAVTMSRGCEVG